jgi:hypothetical protein
MRYWSYFAAKVVAVSAVFFGLSQILNRQWPAETQVIRDHLGHAQVTYIPPRFGWDLGFTACALVLFLLWTVGLNFVIRDQRHRCRVCLRRLRMPVETGSWHRMLFLGRPRIEYICPYGHGTLKEDELQISGGQDPEWTPHSDDIWEELAASGKDSDERP